MPTLDTLERVAAALTRNSSSNSEPPRDWARPARGESRPNPP